MDSSLESDPDHSIDWSIDQMAVLFPAGKKKKSSLFHSDLSRPERKFSLPAIEPEEEIDLEEETPKTKRRRLDWEHVEKIEAERYFDKPAAFLVRNLLSKPKQTNKRSKPRNPINQR